MKHDNPSFGRYVADSNRQNVHSLGKIIDSYDGLAHEYITDRDVRAHQDLVENGNDLSLRIAGAVALDIASKPQNSEQEILTWIDQANTDWQKVIDSNVRVKSFSIEAIKSSIQQQSLPSYLTILLNKELPNKEIRDRYYEGLCDVSTISNSKIRQAIIDKREVNSKDNLNQLLHLSGIIGELAVTLLMQRFIRHELADEEQLALPSRFSEDRGIRRKRGSPIVTAWDVSIFQQFTDEDIEMPYKIQVKTTWNHHKQDKFSYTDDISSVFIKEDLAITTKEQQYGFSPSFIISDILAEQEGSHTAQTTNRLNSRTEKLLDAINS